MRQPRVLAQAAALIASLFCALPSARADQMDPAIERLTKQPVDANGNAVLGPNGAPFTSCAPNGRYIGFNCRADNTAFARLVNQFGAAVAPTAMHSARTTGYGGFHLSIEGAFTGIDNGADYWKRGTQGPKDPNGGFSTSNPEPASQLQLYSIRVRKGFPLGLEVAGQVGFLNQTNIVSGGADVRMALLEGFRKGALGILPDVALGAGVRTITGTPQFNLTVAAFDVQISKTLPVADSSILTPYLGFQQLWIFGDSGLISATPNTDPLGACGYTGPNVPGNPDPGDKLTNPNRLGKPGIYDGQPVCSKGGSPLAFNNTLVFDNVRVTRRRFIIGLNYRYEVLWVGGQFMTDMGNPEDAGGRDNATKLQGVPRQTTLVFELGALF